MSVGSALDDPLTAQEIADARRRIAGVAVRTPLVLASDGRTWLKLECLQPTGSYKIRGATNALRAAVERGAPPRAIVSASAGNFGQAIVDVAARLGDAHGDLEGTQVCRRIREHSEVPILVLSARASESDKVSALEAATTILTAKPRARIRMPRIMVSSFDSGKCDKGVPWR